MPCTWYNSLTPRSFAFLFDPFIAQVKFGVKICSDICPRQEIIKVRGWISHKDPLTKARFRRRTSHEPNRMLMRENKGFFSFAFDSAHVKYGVWTWPKRGITVSKNNIKVIFRLGAQFFRGSYSRDAWTAEATFTKVFYAVSRVFVRPGFRLFCARFAVHYLTVYSV